MSAPVVWANRIVGFRMVPPEDLLANPRNFRRHPNAQREKIRASLNALGWVSPLHQNVRTGHLLDGHMRTEEALSAHADLVPVLDLDLAEEEEPLFLATFDAIGALAAVDRAALDAVLQETQTDEQALQQLCADLAAEAGLAYGTEPEPAPEAQVDRAAELQAQWGTARGQLWEIPSQTVPGQCHRLLCGDSTDAADVARLMGGLTPKMVFADPPYGVSIVATNVSVGGGEAYDIPFGGGHGRKRLGSVGGAKPFGNEPVRGSVGATNVVAVGKYLPVKGDDTTDTATTAYQASASTWPDAVQVWWGGNYYANALPPSACWLVWDKDNTGNFADCELAWTNQGRAARLFRHQWNGMVRASERGPRWHPTQKPVALAVWCFELLGQAGDVIFDPFLGAGMSVVAAEQTQRIGCGLEYEAGYLAVALQRLADLGLEPRQADG